MIELLTLWFSIKQADRQWAFTESRLILHAQGTTVKLLFTFPVDRNFVVRCSIFWAGEYQNLAVFIADLLHDGGVHGTMGSNEKVRNHNTWWRSDGGHVSPREGNSSWANNIYYGPQATDPSILSQLVRGHVFPARTTNVPCGEKKSFSIVYILYLWASLVCSSSTSRHALCMGLMEVWACVRRYTHHQFKINYRYCHRNRHRSKILKWYRLLYHR
jgi:hypothetical protein